MKIPLNKDNYVNLLRLDTVFERPTGERHIITAWPVEYGDFESINLIWVKRGFSSPYKRLGRGMSDSLPNIRQYDNWGYVIINEEYEDNNTK